MFVVPPPVEVIHWSTDVRKLLQMDAGNDCAGAATPTDAIIICGAKRSNRYRIIDSLPAAEAGSSQGRMASRVSVFNQMGSTGVGSCSAVGPGGFTGCLTRQIQGWSGGHGIRF